MVGHRQRRPTTLLDERGSCGCLSGGPSRTRKTIHASVVEDGVVSGYAALLADLKNRIVTARLDAARAVNRELILPYWDIGCRIVEKQAKAGRGDSVVERLASDLRAAFPQMSGFSGRNLRDMRRFYLACTSKEFLSHAVRELVASVPWSAIRRDRAFTFDNPPSVNASANRLPPSGTRWRTS